MGHGALIPLVLPGHVNVTSVGVQNRSLLCLDGYKSYDGH